MSLHDIRQANNIGPFADLVRRVATSVRGDYTYDDRIDLLDMPKISLKNNGLDYGVDPNTSFWIRHGFFQFSNFRQSKDEELLASAMSMCLLGKRFHVSAKNLDRLYDSTSEFSVKATDVIEKCGKDCLEKEFSNIITEIDSVFNAVHSNFSDYLFDEARTANKDICFTALFYALFELHRSGYVITDFKGVADTLKQYCDVTFTQIANDSSYEVKQKAIDVLISMLQNVMTRQLARERTDDDKLLEHLLSLSSVEHQMVEFKITLTSFSDGQWNDNEIKRIGKTLVAMANTNNIKSSAGYVIVGVADDPNDYEDWDAVYHQKPVTFGKHYVVGMQAEARRRYKNVDAFVRAFSQKFRTLPMSKNVLDYVLQNMRVVDFHDKDLLILPVEHTGNSKFDGERYRRENSETIKMN